VVGTGPAGAYTTRAQVPNLKSVNGTIMPNGTYSTVTVALVGLHVVGYTINHQEFIWGTFEHNLNTPATPDFTFQPSPSIKCSAGFTFCPNGTPYSTVNLCAWPGGSQYCKGGNLTLNGQAVSPITFAVQENATGGDTQPNGPSDIQNVNVQGQSHLKSTFQYYHLVGTVWMEPNKYNVNSTVANSVGSINLTNTTAETFQQLATKPTTPSNNCFECHNPGANNYKACNFNALPNNIIGVSHVITLGTPWAVENQIPPSCPDVLGNRPGTKR
jgi:Pyruvate/2-oxoacid:ferredoxin oxidoreductase delta subunit